MTASSIPDLCGGVSPLPLHAYVAVILGEAQAPALSCCQTVEEAWVDGGLTVRRAVTLCTFANGVVIRRTVEEDGGGLEQDGVCRECWIAYEVLVGGPEAAVQPLRMGFGSRCRERFWLRYMMA